MVHQLFVLSICCFLMFLGGLVKADDKIVALNVNITNHLYAGVDRLKNDVEILKKEIDVLKDITSDTENQNSKGDVQGDMAGFFNTTYRKYNMFEERIITKLDEIQEELFTSLNKILIRQNPSENCQQGWGMVVMSLDLSEINEKIDKFEEQLKGSESLEQKLKEQQDKVQALNDGQMKILNEINEKLTQNQLKFDNLEKDMQNFKEMAEIKSSQSKRLLPKVLILGLTENQGKQQAV